MPNCQIHNQLSDVYRCTTSTWTGMLFWEANYIFLVANTLSLHITDIK